MFADKANMNIIFHNTVRGEVTLDLKDVPINTALEFVLDACELTYIRQDNNIIIASKDAAKDLSYARQNFTTIPVKYVNAQSVADFVNKSMFNGKYQGISSVPVVAVNANKNELMVFGTEEDELLIKKILTKLDVKPMMNVFPVNHISPQEMAATICDTILSDKSEGGANQGVSISTPSRGSGGDETITLSGTYSFENDSTKELSFDNGNWKYYYNAAERQSGSYTISDTTLSMSQTGFEDYPSRFALESTQTSVTLISQDTISNILNGFGITENSLTLIKK